MLLSALLAAALNTAAPQAPSSARVVETYSREWARRPSGDDMATVYPLPARREMRVGVAVALCVVGRDGAMTECKISGERPEGLGFGAAAVALAAKFRLKNATPGSLSPAGSQILIPIPFRIAGGS